MSQDLKPGHLAPELLLCWFTKRNFFFFFQFVQNREIYIQSYMNKTLFIKAISGEDSNYVFYDQNWKKILKLLFIFYIKSFLYRINHLFIQVLENLVDLAYSSCTKTKSEDMHDFSALEVSSMRVLTFSLETLARLEEEPPPFLLI